MDLSSMIELLMPESLTLLHPEQLLQVFHVEEGQKLIAQGQRRAKDLLIELTQNPDFKQALLLHPINEQGHPVPTEIAYAQAHHDKTLLLDAFIKQLRSILSEKLDIGLMEQTDEILVQGGSSEFYWGFVSALNWAFQTINLFTESEYSAEFQPHLPGVAYYTVSNRMMAMTAIAAKRYEDSLR